MIILLLSLFGGIGAVSRFVADGVLRTVFGRHFPWSTIIINVIGSFVLGVLTALVLNHGVNSDFKLVIGTGFCGGFTTFSTAMFEAVRLLEENRLFAALFQIVATVILCMTVAGLGMLVA